MQFLPEILAVLLGLVLGMIPDSDPGHVFVVGFPGSIAVSLAVCSLILALIWPSGFWRRSLLIDLAFAAGLWMQGPLLFLSALEDSLFVNCLQALLAGAAGAAIRTAWKWALRDPSENDQPRQFSPAFHPPDANMGIPVRELRPQQRELLDPPRELQPSDQELQTPDSSLKPPDSLAIPLGDALESPTAHPRSEGGDEGDGCDRRAGN